MSINIISGVISELLNIRPAVNIKGMNAILYIFFNVKDDLSRLSKTVLPSLKRGFRSFTLFRYIVFFANVSDVWD